MQALPLPPICPLPTWKQAARFAKEPLELLTECSETLGDIFCLRFPGAEHWAFLSSPHAARQLFRAPRDHLTAGQIHSRFLGALFGTDATFCLDGQAHKHRQKMLIPLLSAKANARHVSLFRQMIEDRINSWDTDRAFPLLTEMHRVSLEFLVRLVFGDKDPQFNAHLAERFERFSALGARSKLVAMPKLQWNLGRWSPWGRIIHSREEVRGLIRDKIAAARQDRSLIQDSILAQLMFKPDGGGQFLKDETLIDEIMNLLFAGHETTGGFLTWCLECLAGHPHIRAELLHQLDEIVGDQPFGPEHLDKVPYLTAVIQETFRFRPAGPFSSFRTVAQPIEIEGERGRFVLPAGFVVAQCFPIMGKRGDLFPNPESFEPERFIRGDHNAYDWTPFGGGGRVCTGRGLAMLELQVAVATIVRRVEIEPVHEQVKVERCGHLLAPAGGLPVRVRLQ